jgi:hypothetical protein
MSRSNKWESDLASLSRNYLTWERFGDRIDDLNRETHDRSVAIGVGSLMEHLLRLCILENMIPLKPSGEKEIFEGPNAPLGTYSARILIGYTLRLYGLKTKRELNKLRLIRNAFSHTFDEITFETKEVKAACYKLSFWEGLVALHDMPDLRAETIAKLGKSPKHRYVHSATFIADNLSNHVWRPKGGQLDHRMRTRRAVLMDLGPTSPLD